MQKIDVEKARKDGWIEAWFAIEVLGGSIDIVERSLKEHTAKLSETDNIIVYKTDFSKINEVKEPPKPLKHGWTQVVNVSLYAKDLYTLIRAIILYGPSAIEILSPPSKQISASEIQNITNTLAGLMHQFAAAGVGGIVITPGPDER